MKGKYLLLIVAAAALTFIIGCSNPFSGTNSSTNGGTDSMTEFRKSVVSSVTNVPEAPSPTDVYALSIEIDTAAGMYGIGDSDKIQVVNDEITDTELRDLVLLVIRDGYSLQDLMGEMEGVFVDEEEQIVTGLDLNENINDDSTVQISGDTQWMTGVEGSGMEFDSEGEYLLLPDNDNQDLTTEEAAIEVWVYPYSNIAAAGIVHKGTELDYSDESYSLQYNQPGQVAIILTNENDKHTYIISNEERLAVNEWHHIVITWDLTNVWMYIDGVEVTDNLYYQNGWKSSLPADFAPIKQSDGDLMIGSQIPYSYRFDGIIDNVMLYSRVLDATEVSEKYNEFGA